MGSLLLAYLAEMGLLSYRDIKEGRTIAGLPVPADLLVVTGLFMALGMATKSSNKDAARAANLAGWAIVVASALNVMPGVPKAKSTKPASTTGGTAS